MAPPFLPQPLHRPPLASGMLRLPAVPHPHRSTNGPARAPLPAAGNPHREPTDSGNHPHRDPAGPDRPHRARDTADRAHLAPGSADGRHPVPDIDDRAQHASHGTDSAHRTPGNPNPPPPATGSADGTHPADADPGWGAGTGDHPRRPPVPAGGLRPPGGERLGRLPEPLGPDRLASGVPPCRSAAAFDLPARPAAVGAARCVVHDLLTAWGAPADTLDDAVLVISELVTNALLHSAGKRIACRLHGTADRIRIEVEDQEGGPARPRARRPGPDDQHGRGLFLVDVLSLDWGVAPLSERPARVVWAELPAGDD